MQRRSRALPLFFLAFAQACRDGSPPTTAVPDSARALVVESIRDVGVVRMPPTLVGRDGGNCGLIGGKVLWTFGDTFWPFAAVDGATYRTNTAALADASLPLATTEPTDSKGAPVQFIPFTAAEKQFNDSTGKPDDRIAIWPGSVIPSGSGGIVFFLKLRVRGNLSYDFLGSGIARVTAGSTTATRDPGLIFGPAEPHFNLAMLTSDFLYVYGDLTGNSANFGVGRVALQDVGTRSAYRFWNGAAWVADVTKIASVISNAPGGASVSYNPYLKQYVAAHAGMLSKSIFLRTARRPEGPFSAPIEAFVGLDPGSGGAFAVNYAGLEHPELAKEGGKILAVTYAHPLSGFLQGEVRFVEVTLR